MRIRLSATLAVTAACALAAGTSAASAATQGQVGRAVIATTVPVSGSGTPGALGAGTRLRLSVFVGRDQAGLAAAAAAVSIRPDLVTGTTSARPRCGLVSVRPPRSRARCATG